MNSSSLDIPEENFNDFFHKLLKGTVGSLPFAGGVLAELYDSVLTPSLEQRRNIWMQEVANAILVLKAKAEENFTIESLKTNEEFISIFLHLTRIAIRNHQKEKTIALRNALISTYVSNLDYDLKLSFINLVDDISPSHIFILNFYKEQESLIKNIDSFKEIYNVFKSATTQQKNIHEENFIYFSRNLEDKKLIVISNDVEEEIIVKTKNSPWIAVNNDNPDFPFIKVTKLGELFLDFIVS